MNPKPNCTSNPEMTKKKKEEEEEEEFEIDREEMKGNERGG